MRVAEALKKAGADNTISSKKCKMMEQNRTTLAYWILIWPDETFKPKRVKDQHSVGQLEEILKATDWKVDEK